MAQTKVSALSELTSPDGAEELLINDGGTSKKITITNVSKLNLKGGDLASASPLVIDTDGNYFDVTGTTNFAAMTVAVDRQFTLQFAAALTMTHDGTALDLPGEANITTAAGDVATFQSTAANQVQCISYTRAAGTAVVGSSDLPTAPSGISTDTNEKYSLKLTDASDTETLSWTSFAIKDDTTPQLGGMLDVNGNSIGDGTLELLKFSETGSAVNEFTIANAATGNAPNLSATGGDDNIDISITPKGTGSVVLGGDLDCNGSQIQWSQGADVASTGALPVLTDGNYFDVTGTTTITSINTTGGVGTLIKLHFDGALTLTHHATDLILPSGANITTAAGDEAEFIEYASGDYRCTNYSKASGEAVIGGAGATGGGSDEVFYENGQTVTTSYELTAGKNAMCAGPITINSSIAVTVPSGATWVIV